MKKLYFLILLCAVAGCSAKESMSLVKIGAEKILNEEPEIKDLRELCDSLTVVQLETTDESMIGVIEDIVSYNDVLVLLWEGKCSIFKKDGTFVANVGVKGNGPNEFGWFEYAFVADGKIVLYDSSKNKLFQYDISGNFIAANEIPVRLGNSRGAFMPDSRFIGFYMPDKGYSKEWKMIHFVTVDGDLGDSVVVASKLSGPSNVNWYFKECSFIENQGGVKVKYTFNDTVYNVVSDKGKYTLMPAMKFELGQYAAIENAREKSFQAMMTSVRYNPFDQMAKIELLGESDRYLFFAANGERGYLFNKSVGNIHKYKLTYNGCEDVRPVKIDTEGKMWAIVETDSNNNPQIIIGK